MRDLIHWHGLGWDGPPQEGLVFTLGGALGLTYLPSSDDVPPLYLVGRNSDFEIDLPRRLGGHVSVLTTDDPAEGWSWVAADIDAGRPTLVWADIAELPYLRVQLQMSRHDIVIIGYDLSRRIAFVVDNDRAEVQEVPLDALARARSSTAFPEPTRHRTYRITWPEQLPDLRTIAASAFTQSVRRMRHPSEPGIVDTTTSGVEGMAAASRLAEDLQSWTDLPDDELTVRLFSLGAFIEKAGTGGGLFRRLLAEGCGDISRLTGDKATAELAVTAGVCAEVWSDIARKATQRDIHVRDRVDHAAATAGRLPELEYKLVEALETASHSLRLTGR
jgi:hypothetical protein